MSLMTLSDAKKYFHAGALDAFRLEKAPLGGWVVAVRFDGWCHICPQREKSPRLFASADTALAAVEQIGFRVVALTGV